MDDVGVSWDEYDRVRRRKLEADGMSDEQLLFALQTRFGDLRDRVLDLETDLADRQEVRSETIQSIEDQIIDSHREQMVRLRKRIGSAVLQEQAAVDLMFRLAKHLCDPTEIERIGTKTLNLLAAVRAFDSRRYDAEVRGLSQERGDGLPNPVV